MGLFGIGNKKKEEDGRKRKYHVPRGTAAQLERDGMATAVHIGYVIRGIRTPSAELSEKLAEIEAEYARTREMAVQH